jgi:hypothetical protein
MPSPNAKHLPSVMKNTDRGFEDGYDSDGELGPFNGRGYRAKGVWRGGPFE